MVMEGRREKGANAIQSHFPPASDDFGLERSDFTSCPAKPTTRPYRESHGAGTGITTMKDVRETYQAETIMMNTRV
jgi:hypothetical protein